MALLAGTLIFFGALAIATAALTQSPAAIFVLFSAVGVGLALPYLVLLAVPSLMDRIPRTGAWLLRIQQLLGIILLGAAVFFASTALPAFLGPFLWIAWAALGAFWILRALIRGPGMIARAVPAIVLLVSFATAPFVLTTQSANNGLNWQPLTQQAVTMAQTARRPVLIEFTADWCINCKVLERTVYNTQRVIQAAEAADVLALQADLTRSNDWLQRQLRNLGGAGMPYAVVIGTDGHVTRKLPDLFSVDTLVTAIQEASANHP